MARSRRHAGAVQAKSIFEYIPIENELNGYWKQSMENRDSILLVSEDSELHRLLEIVAATYGFTLLGANSVEKGLGLFKNAGPNCIIFDLDILHNPRDRNAVKERLQESGVPALLLDGLAGRSQNPADLPPPFDVEPIVKFIMDTRDKSRRDSKGGFRKRLLSFFRFGNAK